MNKEDLILAKLESLEAELKETKASMAVYRDLKTDFEPIMKQVVNEVICKLDRLGSRLQVDDLEDLVSSTLTSSGNLAEAVKMLNSMMELKETAAPIVKGAMNDAIDALDGVSYRFSIEDIGGLVHHTFLNFNNLTEALKILDSLMDLKDSAGEIPGLAMATLTDRLEDFKQRGGFEGVQALAQLGDRLVTGLAGVNLDEVKPVGGIFGLLGALGKPEVKKGLGVALELAAALGKSQPK